MTDSGLRVENCRKFHGAHNRRIRSLNNKMSHRQRADQRTSSWPGAGCPILRVSREGWVIECSETALLSPPKNSHLERDPGRSRTEEWRIPRINPKQQTRPLHSAGRHRRLPCPSRHTRRHRLASHRHPLRHSRPNHTLTHHRTQPSRSRLHDSRPPGRSRYSRHPNQRANSKELPLTTQRPRRSPRQTQSPHRSPHRVRTRRHPNPQHPRTRPPPQTSKRLRAIHPLRINLTVTKLGAPSSARICA